VDACFFLGLDGKQPKVGARVLFLSKVIGISWLIDKITSPPKKASSFLFSISDRNMPFTDHNTSAYLPAPSLKYFLLLAIIERVEQSPSTDSTLTM
jgi:hypothetical protein